MVVRSTMGADGIADVVIDRPPVNALDVDHIGRLAEILDWLGRHQAVRGVVLTGSGGAFCAGVDIKAWGNDTDPDHRQWRQAINRFVAAMVNLTVPFGVAVNGHALGGGFVIVLAADVRCCASGPFRLGLTEVANGVPFPQGALEVVVRELDPAALRHLVLAGEILTPEEAARLRLLDVVVPPGDVLGVTRQRIRDLADLTSFQVIKRQLAAVRCTPGRPADTEGKGDGHGPP